MADFNIDDLLTRLKNQRRPGVGGSSYMGPQPAMAQDNASSQMTNGVEQPTVQDPNATPIQGPSPASTQMSAFNSPGVRVPGMTGLSPEEKALRKKIEAQFLGNLSDRNKDIAGDRTALDKEENKDAFEKVDLSGLYALARAAGGDAELGKGYAAPKDNTELVAKLRDNLSKHQGGIADDQLNLLRFQLQNKSTDQATMQANRLAIQEDRMDRNEHMKTIAALNSNKGLADRVNQYQNLDNALALITNTKNVTPQQVREFQQTVRSNLGIKGTSGVGEREGTYLNSLGLNADTWGQFLSGDPANISKNDPILKHIKDLALQEQGNVRGQYGTALDAVSEGRGSMYARRPDLQGDLKSKISAMAKRVGANSAQAAGNHPTPDQINKMSADELKAYLGQ